MARLKLNQLTFGQARRRGYTKAEWQRSIKISRSLKSYYEKKRPPQTHKKYTYQIKLKYESDRDKFHNFRTEFTLEVIRDKEPTAQELKEFIINHLEEVADGEDFLLGIPFDDVIIGLSKVEDTTQAIGHLFSQVFYGHNL